MPIQPPPMGKRVTIARADDSSDSDTLTMDKPAVVSRAQKTATASKTVESDITDKDEPPFLADIHDEEERKRVRIILHFTTSIEDRLQRIKNVDVKLSIYEKCKAWLNEKENSTDFISLLSKDVQGMAIEYEEEKDAQGLEQLVIQSGSEKAKDAFDRWKLKNGFVDNDGRKKGDDGAEQRKEKKRTGKNKKGDKKHTAESGEEKSEGEKPMEKPRKHRKQEKDENPRKSHHRKPESKDEKSPRGEEHRSKGGKSYQTEDEEDSSFEDAVEELGPKFAMFSANMPEEMNVVLLGGTGNGKSTWINAIANLLTRDTLADACENPTVLIKTFFHHYGSDGSSKLIEHDPTISVERQGANDGEDEDNRTGQSATQSPRSYIFEFGSPENKKILRLIDTPGVGDVRGIDQDKLNFTKIVNFISSFQKIHAFLFLLKPNEARLDLGFRYGMNELLRHLHASAANNIIFCMTNGKGVGYNPGETYPTLKKYLDGIYDEKQIRIQLDERYFVYDSIHFRFAAAHRYNIRYSANDVKGFEESWVFGRERLSNMISLISTFEPHDVKNTLSVNKVRRAIELMARPLAEIAKNQLENMNIIERKRKEIEDCLANGEDLRGSLYIEQIHMDTEDLEQPVTVCTHGECVDRIPLHPNGAEEIVYTQECHKACYLRNLIPGEMPNENIKECEIFADRVDENRCTQCGHGYEVHMHMKYRLVRRVERFINREIEESLESNANQVEVAKQFIADREEQRLAYQRDLEKKQMYCAHFAIFLQKNSVLHYNDQYLAYLTNMIREEEQANRMGGSDETLEKLKDARAQYTEIVKVFEQTANLGGKAKSIHEIEAMIEELKDMDNGEIVRDVEKLEWFNTNPYVHMDPIVHVDSSYVLDKVEKLWNVTMNKVRGGKGKKPKNKPKRQAVHERPLYYR